jgi:transposase-like protein
LKAWRGLMTEVNWQRDYHGEFACPRCSYLPLRLKGNYGETKKFFCSQCQNTIIGSVQLSSRSRYLDSRMKDEYIDWEQDYHNEFICPECDAPGIYPRGIRKKSGKRHFFCSACKKKQEASCEISIIKIEDPLNLGVNWYTSHRIEGFVCPKCQAEDVYLTEIISGKKRFKCKSCKHYQFDSLILNNVNVSHYSENTSLAIKSFNWKNEQWDLRTINCSDPQY